VGSLRPKRGGTASGSLLNLQPARGKPFAAARNRSTGAGLDQGPVIIRLLNRAFPIGSWHQAGSSATARGRGPAAAGERAISAGLQGRDWPPMRFGRGISAFSCRNGASVVAFLPVTLVSMSGADKVVGLGDVAEVEFHPRSQAELGWQRAWPEKSAKSTGQTGL